MPIIDTEKEDHFTPVDRVVECMAVVLIELTRLSLAIDRLAVAVQSLHSRASGGYE